MLPITHAWSGPFSSFSLWIWLERSLRESTTRWGDLLHAGRGGGGGGGSTTLAFLPPPPVSSLGRVKKRERGRLTIVRQNIRESTNTKARKECHVLGKANIGRFFLVLLFHYLGTAASNLLRSRSLDLKLLYYSSTLKVLVLWKFSCSAFVAHNLPLVWLPHMVLWRLSPPPSSALAFQSCSLIEFNFPAAHTLYYVLLHPSCNLRCQNIRQSNRH